MNTDVYKAGIIGLGRIGFSLMYDSKREQPASHSAALEENERIKIICGCDIDIKKLEKWQKRFPDAVIYNSHTTMLEKNKLDILVIAVNEENHLKIFKDVVKYDIKTIILEKPAGINIEETKEIIRLADKHRIKVFINHERRYSENYLYVKDIIKNKTYGDIKFINGKILSSSPAIKKEGIGTLVRDSSHLFDIINFLTDGKVEILSAISNKNNIGIHTCGRVYDINNNEIIVSVDIGYAIKSFVFELDIFFTNGRIMIGNGYLNIYKADVSPYYEKMYSLIKVKDTPLFEKTNYFRNMVKNVVNYLDGKEDDYSDIHQSLASFECIDVIKKLIS